MVESGSVVLGNGPGDVQRFNEYEKGTNEVKLDKCVVGFLRKFYVCGPDNEWY